MFSGKRVPIARAEVVKDKGFERPVELISANLLSQTAQKIPNTASSFTLASSLSEDQWIFTRTDTSRDVSRSTSPSSRIPNRPSSEGLKKLREAAASQKGLSTITYRAIENSV